MRWPLVLLALLVVLLQGLKVVSGDKGPDWERAAEAARHVFIPFSVAALLMIAFGKPTLPAQYAAWAVFILQVVTSYAAVARLALAERYTHWISLALVAYLWILLLPLFDAIPA